MSKTLQELFENRGEAISGLYEVVRTVGFSVKSAAGEKECRIEAIRRPGQKTHEIQVSVRSANGDWRREPAYESEALNHKDVEESLMAAVEHIGRKAAEAPAPVVPAAAAPKPAPAVSDEVGPDILAVLSAAVAAFLGKTARIRGARPLRTSTSSAWAQQGRVYIQGSHNLSRG